MFTRDFPSGRVATLRSSQIVSYLQHNFLNEIGMILDGNNLIVPSQNAEQLCRTSDIVRNLWYAKFHDVSDNDLHQGPSNTPAAWCDRFVNALGVFRHNIFAGHA